MHYFYCVFDHDWVMQIWEGVFMGHTFQEKLVHIVVFNTFWHLFIEVSWLSGTFHLNIDLVLTLLAKLVRVQRATIVGAKSLLNHER